MAKEEISWSDIFNTDKDERSAWVTEAKEALAFLDNDFDPLQSIGLVDENSQNPWFKISSIPKVLRYIYGRVFSNPIEPTIVPYEGEVAEEDVRKICEALFRYEMTARRGAFGLNLISEIKRTVMDALAVGYGATDARLDETLRTPMYYRGQPIYTRIDPLDVIFDSRARRFEEIRHLHIRSRYDPDDFEKIFNKKVRDFAPGAVKEDEDEDEEMVQVVETQFRRVEVSETLEIPQEIKQEFGIDSDYMPRAQFSEIIKAVKESDPEKYDYLDARKITANMRSFRKQDWGVYSLYWAGDSQKPLLDEVYVGKNFSVEILGFFPKSKSAYFNGIPFYLKDIQNLEIIGQTLRARMLMRADKQGAIVKGKLSPDFKEQWKKNIIGDILELDSPEEQPIENLIKMRDATSALQYLSQFLDYTQYMIDDQFGTHKEQTGRAPFAGSSGKLVENLIAVGSYMFVIFADKLNEFLPKIFDRALRLAAESLPPEALMIIAGENDAGRQAMIKTGAFYQRIAALNAYAKLDTTTEADRAMQKQIVAGLIGKGGWITETGFAMLGFDEPKKIAEEITANNQALQLGLTLLSDPNLANAAKKLISEYKMLTGNTQTSAGSNPAGSPAR